MLTKSLCFVMDYLYTSERNRGDIALTRSLETRTPTIPEYTHVMLTHTC